MATQTIARRYHVIRAVGRGGMGTVWLCNDEVLGRQVAVKQVGTLPGETTLDLARALREARSSAALNHRNVVSVYDAVEEGDHIWLVMEYVPGRTLAEIVAQDGPLAPGRAVWIGAQVADGLAAAHARGTIHRDVKPGNVLVTDDDVAKISDFGIARTHGDDQVTRAGLLTGTPAYFSPEVARGEDPGPAADVWALGATLYAAVEGRPLYPEQPNAIALLGTIAHGRPARPERAGFLTEPIGRMLDPDPQSRWSMADAAYVLHRLNERHSPQAAMRTQAVTASFVPPVADEAAAAPAPASAPAAAAPAAPPEAPGREGRSGPSVDELSEEPTRRRRGGGLVVLAVLATVLALAVVAGAYLLLDPGDGSRASDQTAADAPRTRTSESTSGTPSPSTSDTTETSPSPSETTPSATTAPVAGGKTARFVTGYYGMLPDDTAGAWSLLSPSYQGELGYDSYRGFWSTIADVAVTDTKPAGNGAVDVTLSYTHENGSTEPEVRRVFVQRSGDSYQITGSEIVG